MHPVFFYLIEFPCTVMYLKLHANDMQMREHQKLEGETTGTCYTGERRFHFSVCRIVIPNLLKWYTMKCICRVQHFGFNTKQEITFPLTSRRNQSEEVRGNQKLRACCRAGWGRILNWIMGGWCRGRQVGAEVKVRREEERRGGWVFFLSLSYLSREEMGRHNKDLWQI